jgi:small subunit ribosomal protein S16
VSVKIRLQRMGRKKQPTFRIVVTESRNARNGEVIEAVGNYCPYIKDQPLTIDMDRIDEWRKKGAIPSDAVMRLLRKVQKAAKAAPATSVKKMKAEKPAEETAPIPVPAEPETEQSEPQSIS